LFENCLISLPIHVTKELKIRQKKSHSLGVAFCKSKQNYCLFQVAVQLSEPKIAVPKFGTVKPHELSMTTSTLGGHCVITGLIVSKIAAVKVHVPLFPASSVVPIVMVVFEVIVVPGGGVCVKIICAVAVQLSVALESPR
jgi:hypothetical protein